MNDFASLLSDGIANPFNGFGPSSLDGGTLEALQKALTAGAGVDASMFTGGRALIPESLETTLVNILHSNEEAVLFSMIKKRNIPSPVHQWDERTEVGIDDAGWVAEAGESKETDQTIARRSVEAKYLQTMRKVTLQASLSNMIEEAVALEKNAGALWIIRNIERAMWSGNSSLFPFQFDGVDAQLDMIPANEGNIIDLRGGEATTNAFENKMVESCRVIREHFGKATNVFGSPKFLQDVQVLLRDRLRFQAQEEGLGATVFNRYPTPFGTPMLTDDLFISADGRTDGEGNVPRASAYTTDRPTKPTMAVAAAATASGEVSQFATAQAGDYTYRAVMSNHFGDSPASDAAVVTVAAGQKVTVTITPATGKNASAYKVYRSKLGGTATSEVRFAFRGPVTQTNGVNVATAAVDLNADLPGTGSVYVLNMDPVYGAIEWCQFLPLMKFNLYPTATAIRPFLLLLYGALAVKKKVQHVRIKNVSPTGLDWH